MVSSGFCVLLGLVDTVAVGDGDALLLGAANAGVVPEQTKAPANNKLAIFLLFTLILFSFLFSKDSVFPLFDNLFTFSFNSFR